MPSPPTRPSYGAAQEAKTDASRIGQLDKISVRDLRISGVFVISEAYLLLVERVEVDTNGAAYVGWRPAFA
jgi:hypothetical protein